MGYPARQVPCTQMWPPSWVHWVLVAIWPCGQLHVFRSHSCVEGLRWRQASLHEVHLLSPWLGHAAPVAALPKLPGQLHFFSSHVCDPLGR